MNLTNELEDILRQKDTGQISDAMTITNVRHVLRVYKKKQADFEKQREIRAYETYYAGGNPND